MELEHCIILFCVLDSIYMHSVIEGIEDWKPTEPGNDNEIGNEDEVTTSEPSSQPAASDKNETEIDEELAKTAPLLYQLGEDIEAEMPEVKSPEYEPDAVYFGLLFEKLGTRLEQYENTDELVQEVDLTFDVKEEALTSKVDDLLANVANASGDSLILNPPAAHNDTDKKDRLFFGEAFRLIGQWLLDLFKNYVIDAAKEEIKRIVDEKVREVVGEAYENIKDRLAMPHDTSKLTAATMTKFIIPFIIERMSLSHGSGNQTERSGQQTIRYYFDKNSYDKVIERRLRSVMNKIEREACVRFESVRSEWSDTKSTPLIQVTNPRNQRECSHEPVYLSPHVAQLVLGIDCLQEREILHSLLHTIGFYDEVTHPNRDKYVRVMWDNIQPKYRKLYRTKGKKFITPIPVEYDPLSIMHFHTRAFSSNGRPTIVPVIPGLTIYQSNDLSTLDKLKLRMIFGPYCNRRELAELMNSCNTILKDEKQKPDDEDGEVGANEGADKFPDENTSSDPTVIENIPN